MTEMIERVARALAVEAGADPDAIGTNVPLWRASNNVYVIDQTLCAPTWTFYERQARAAIEAMQHPTEAMMDAMFGSSDLWCAGINAALVEPPPKARHPNAKITIKSGYDPMEEW